VQFPGIGRSSVTAEHRQASLPHVGFDFSLEPRGARAAVLAKLAANVAAKKQ
jgi:hypothetical protein